MTAYSHGQSVRVLDCPDHRGKVGEVLDTYLTQVRIGFDDGTRCWPRRIEPAEWRSAEPNDDQSRPGAFQGYSSGL